LRLCGKPLLIGIDVHRTPLQAFLWLTERDSLACSGWQVKKRTWWFLAKAPMEWTAALRRVASRSVKGSSSREEAGHVFGRPGEKRLNRQDAKSAKGRGDREWWGG
jgi:hypothetical protein